MPPLGSLWIFLVASRTFLQESSKPTSLNSYLLPAARKSFRQRGGQMSLEKRCEWIWPADVAKEENI